MLITGGRDPDVLHGAALEHPGEMSLDAHGWNAVAEHVIVQLPAPAAHHARVGLSVLAQARMGAASEQCFGESLMHVKKLGSPVPGGFQNPAHFSRHARAAQISDLRRGEAKSAAECVAQVAVAGEAELEGQRAEVSLPLREPP